MGIVVDIDNDIGLNEWDVVSSDPDLMAHLDAALGQSTWGMRVHIDDTGNLYGQANFTPGAAAFRARFYIDPNAITIPDNTTFTVVSFTGTAGIIAHIELNWTGAAYRLRLRSIEDDESATNTYVVITDAEHWVEVCVERGAGTGQHRMWIDDSLEATHSSLDNDAKYDGVTNMKAGALYITTGTDGYLYLDEFVIRDDDTEIGPNSTTTSTTTTGGTTTTGAGSTTLSGSGSSSTLTISSTETTTTTTGTTTEATTTGATTTAAPTTIKLRDGPGGHTARAAEGDFMVIRSLDGTGTWRETWVEVTSVTDPGGGVAYYEYGVERKSGDAVEHPEGATFVNYGPAGGSIIRVIGEEA